MLPILGRWVSREMSETPSPHGPSHRMTDAIAIYVLVGLAYWLCTVALPGEPEALRQDPLALRVKIHFLAAVLAVVGWPAGMAVDLRRLCR